MRVRCSLILLCLFLARLGMASMGDFKKYPVDGGDPSRSWNVQEMKGGGNVIGPAVTDRCFRYSGGRKIVRDRHQKLHVVYVDPYPSNPNDIPPSNGPYNSCTYATSTDEGETWERTFLDDDYFSRYPAIAIHGDTLHVIYTNWDRKSSDSNIEYTRSTNLGETWLPEAINITSGVFSTGGCDYAGLDVDLDGNPHVSFIWPDDQAVYWTMSPNGGDTWTEPEQVSYGSMNGTISFTNVVINPHTNQPHIFFSADGAAGFYGDKNYYHTFHRYGLWSYPTENVTGHPANDAHCWGCGSLVFDADETEYAAYFFVDDRQGGPSGSIRGIGVYKRTDFSTNLGVDPREVWGDPISVAHDSEPQFESDPWYPNAVINPGFNPTSADDDMIFCVFATGQSGQDGVGEIFIKYSTDRGLTWWNDWPWNPLTTDGDVNYDNWPEVDWGHWHRGHLDVAWVARVGSGYEVQYAPAYVIEPRFVRGDVVVRNDDVADTTNVVDMFDALCILYWVGGEAEPPPCINAADANDDEEVDVFDALRILYWLGGEAESLPEPCCEIPVDCGTDPTPGTLPCASYPPCGIGGKAMPKVISIGSAEANRLVIEQPEIEDESVVVPVALTTIEPLIGFSFTLSYDPALLTAWYVDNADLATEGFDLFVGGAREPGVVTVVAVSDLEIADGVERLPAGERRVAMLGFELVGKSQGRDVSLKVTSSTMAISHDRALNHRTVVEEALSTPLTFELLQSCPNPFNAATEIAYTLPREEEVALVVYNLLGQRVRTLIDGLQSAGRHLARWDGRDDQGNPVTSGVYFYRLEAGWDTQTREMLHIK